MSFERILKVPTDRIGALVGTGGEVKRLVEEKCGVRLEIDGKSGEVRIVAEGDLSKENPLRAVDIVIAVSRGFSPQRAMKLMEEDAVLELIDLRDLAGKSEAALERVRGRIIGLRGRTRTLIEELTGALVSIYGHTATIIGEPLSVRSAAQAVAMLASGSPHGLVYKRLQDARTRAKKERLKLWEDQAIG